MPSVRKNVTLHPVLLAVFPILFLYGRNLNSFDAPALTRSLVCVVAAVILVNRLVQRLTGERTRAAILTSLGVLTFFSYGYMYALIEDFWRPVDPSSFSAFEALIHVLCAALLGGIALFFIRCRNPGPWSYFMNVWALLLIVLPLSHFVRDSYRVHSALAQVPRPKVQVEGESLQVTATKPDIYLIVLDSYGRADLLKEFYDYDNSALIGYLRHQGFFVAERSNSNYSKTAASLAATLNLDYIDELAYREVEQLKDWRLARELIEENRVARLLKEQGYTTVALHSLYPRAQFTNVDLLLTKSWFPNLFEIGLMKTTPIPWWLRKVGKPVLEDLHRLMTLYTLDKLPQLTELEGPKFVYAHVLCPHPPFLFGPDGEPREPGRIYRWLDGERFRRSGGGKEEYVKGYVDQVRFINTRIRAIVDRILARSDSAPVILLQGDHGPAAAPWIFDRSDPSVRERFGILNALYLPGEDGPSPYDAISPVNTFRLILNRYFGAGYDLLEDRCYFVTDDHLYKPLPVFERRPAGACPS